jgi:hypothetical protein
MDQLSLVSNSTLHIRRPSAELEVASNLDRQEIYAD